MNRHGLLALAAGLALLGAPASASAERRPLVQLYALDCGRIDFPAMDRFSDTDDYPATPGRLIASCFLVRHGRNWLLWDSGVGDRIAAMPGGEEEAGGIRFSMPHALTDQLRALGLDPADIGRIALSHLHADHVGNLDRFPKATFLVSRIEWRWAMGDPRPAGIEARTLAVLARVTVDPVDGDRDVFGDGSVRILRTPGHTPGHQSLLVKLAHSGPVLISGDLYHRRESRAKRLIPKGNASRSDTLASMDRVERLAKTIGARIVIQHDADDFAALPRFPAPLE